MPGKTLPRVLSIPPGVPFLPTLARRFLDGSLLPGYAPGDDPLAPAEATIYVPTRRAARELRSTFVDLAGGRSAILPTIRPLGEFEDDLDLLLSQAEPAPDQTPPIAGLDRILLLAPLVQAWRRHIPAHVASRFQEELVVPVSAADAIWLARDLADLMDEVETANADWSALDRIVPGELAGWWQVTLEFLEIVTKAWPALLAERGRSNPAAHRAGRLEAEAERLLRTRPAAPVIAAGSTGSIPATARLLSAIARLPNGAVVLPGLDDQLDDDSWGALTPETKDPTVFGHPQFGLKALVEAIGVERGDVVEIAAPPAEIAARNHLVREALRPAGTTERWASNHAAVTQALEAGALRKMALVEAANEREEGLAIAVALREALGEGGRSVALVTGDRDLARRVAVELGRFGIRADDSAGSPLAQAAAARFFMLAIRCVLSPGDPVALLSLIKHPMLRLGLGRAMVRHAAETVELVAMRGGTGRPDAVTLAADFEARLEDLASRPHAPFWLERLTPARVDAARAMLSAFADALRLLAAVRDGKASSFAVLTRLAVETMETLGRGADGSVSDLYRGDEGDQFAGFLRALAETETALEFDAAEWPDMVEALIASETVKPAPGADSRVAIWGALEARLQSVDTLVIGGLNEGSWPRRAEADRFMSRLMKAELDLDPPERRTGLAAHDFFMAIAQPDVVMTRSARAGDAPALASRWLQRLTTVIGEDGTGALRRRGARYLDWARAIDETEARNGARRPEPAPPREARPRSFSVTEVETLRRDPYAVYARRILKLAPIDPLLRDPGAAERGSLFHDILHDFTRSVADPRAADAEAALRDIGRAHFAAAALPGDVLAVWWPRFERMIPNILDWERNRAAAIAARHSEIRARGTPVDGTGATLAGRADRIDRLSSGAADILDYKTGSTPSKRQANTLLAPQLALEAALLSRGAFQEIGRAEPGDLAHIRLRANGRVEHESILKDGRTEIAAGALAEDAWQRLSRLIGFYEDPATGYLSRAIPLKEGETDGDYDHLARVLEWSAGGDGGTGGGE